jgi:hypothetical protein
LTRRASEEQRLTEEARRSQQATEDLREKGTAAEPEETESSEDPGNPWAKTSSGDADFVSEDE